MCLLLQFISFRLEFLLLSFLFFPFFVYLAFTSPFICHFVRDLKISEDEREFFPIYISILVYTVCVVGLMDVHFRIRRGKADMLVYSSDLHFPLLRWDTTTTQGFSLVTALAEASVAATVLQRHHSHLICLTYYFCFVRY